jgi:hypothetical protein
VELKEFRKVIRGKSASILADDFLKRNVVAAFPDEQHYEQFKDAVKVRYPNAESVVVAGTANWLFSLNPKKAFKTFNESSDIDTVVVSNHHFLEAWEEIRKFHRTHGYQLASDVQDRLRRNGENVYSGFVSPTWIPDHANRFRYEHVRSLNALSNKNVDFKPVKMLFFRNWTEAVDYYGRGFRIAKGNL